MSKIVHVGNGIFVDTEEVEPSKGKARPDVHIYAYASFRSLEHVSFGLMRTTGGPEDEEIDSETVGEYGMEPIAPFWEFGHAMDSIGSKYAFEEVPLVEVETKDEYEEALEAIDLDPEDGDWKGPGLYDFRDSPPTFSGSVEEYEEESLQDAADQAFDYMFQGDEWEETYSKLAAEEG
jgi:hypothetical protein